MNSLLRDITRSVCLLGLCAVLPLSKVSAEDIDLFLGPPTTATGVPNILFVVDNTANWGPVFQEEMEGLAEVFSVLPEVAEVNVGLVLDTESSGSVLDGRNAIDGGYIRAALRYFDGPTADKYAALILGLQEIGDRGAGGKSSKSIAESHFYFQGGEVKAGNQEKADYFENDYNFGNCCAASVDVWEEPGNALAGPRAPQYEKPLSGGVCSGNYIIFIGNGPAQDSTSDSRESTEWLADAGGDTSPVFESGHAPTDRSPFDEWTRFMNSEDYPYDRVKTFTIDIQAPRTSQAEFAWSALLENAADVGGGEYYFLDQEEFDKEEFKNTVFAALSRIVARNSVFASVALPASAGTSSTFLNQVFVGLFRPDPDMKPQWVGNLKQYQLGFEGGDLKVLGADGISIAETDLESENVIKDCAVSFWTPPAEPAKDRDPYWAFLEGEGGCIFSISVPDEDPSVDDSADYDTPDGPFVEKGGHAYILRAGGTVGAPGERDVYTCGVAFSDCDADDEIVAIDYEPSTFTPTAADLGIAEADVPEYLKWTVGFDPNDVNENEETEDMRPYVHGDVVHSRPTALDYNLDPNDPDVVVFYGANDGMLRAINGNQSGTGAGEEYWSFLPPEFYPNISVLRENTAVVKFPASGPSEGIGIDKPYAMDGPMTTYAKDADDDGDYDEVLLYAGMHRGGRVAYAFDVTNPTLKPGFAWKIGCLNDPNDPADCSSSDVEDIGLTWSPFSLTASAGYDSGDTPLILMGGGYDRCEDVDEGASGANHDCDSGTTGNVVYVLDATTGDVLVSFPTLRAVPGVVTVVPYDETNPSYEGLIKYAYAADTGGNVYRISAPAGQPLADADPEVNGEWIMTRIASLGCDEPVPADPDVCTGSNPSNRKFVFGPDVVKVPAQEDYVVLVGSGDREKPLTDYASAYNVPNYFYSILDKPATTDWLDDDNVPESSCMAEGAGNSCCDNSNLICMDGLTTISKANIADGVDSLPDGQTLSPWGWKFELESHEQVVSGALTISDDVYFSTHIPEVYAEDACEGDLGDATTYQLGYREADGEANQIIGGGLVPTPVAGKVIIPGYDDPIPFCIGCGGENSPIGGIEVEGAITWKQPKNRVYWNIKR